MPLSLRFPPFWFPPSQRSRHSAQTCAAENLILCPHNLLACAAGHRTPKVSNFKPCQQSLSPAISYAEGGLCWPHHKATAGGLGSHKTSLMHGPRGRLWLRACALVDAARPHTRVGKLALAVPESPGEVLAPSYGGTQVLFAHQEACNHGCCAARMHALLTPKTTCFGSPYAEEGSPLKEPRT